MTSLPKVAVVGCGYWGKNLVRNFYELGSLEAICDVGAAQLDALHKQYPVTATNTFDELLSIKGIEGIVIAAPASQHHRLAKKALLADKSVFVEKPLALTLDEGEELVELAQKRGRILMVGHLLQYHPAILEIARLLRAGEFGKIEYISSSRLNLGKLRAEENILWSFAPHDLSVILFLLGEMPVSVAAQGASYLNRDICDVTLSVLNFTGGIKAHVFVSWLHPFKEQKLVVVGDRQMAVFDDMESERKLVVYPHRIEWLDRLPVARKAEGRVIPIDSSEPLRLECTHFLECIRDKKVPRTDGENGLNVLKVLHACEQSIGKQGQVVSLGATSRSYFIHPSALADDGCEIGEGTKIWHFSHIMRDSRIGRNCILGQNVHIASRVQIGDNVKIQNNVSIYTGVELEDDVFCGPSMVFTNVINPRSRINRKHQYRPTLIKRGATLGANSTIVCGNTVGRYAFAAAGAVITRDVPDHALMMGVPARQVGWVCECGTKLEFPSAEIGWENENGRDGKMSDAQVQRTSCAVCRIIYELRGSELQKLNELPVVKKVAGEPLLPDHEPEIAKVRVASV